MPPIQGEVSEWVEQIGEKWDKRPEVAKQDEDGLGAYFALSIAAAGWHSGALVLVNDKLVDAVSKSCLVDDPGFSSSSVEPGNQSSRASSEPDVLERMTTLFGGLLRNFLGLPTNIDEDNTLSQGHAFKGKLFSWADQSFPRLQLEHGVEMPGTIPFSDWKEPKPDWKLMWRGDDFTGKVFGVGGWEVQEDNA
jgi:SCF-associated factor 1